MSNVEHLVENGLVRLKDGLSYKEWLEATRKDVNWNDNINMTLDELWDICQYVTYTWVPCELWEDE